MPHNEPAKAFPLPNAPDSAANPRGTLTLRISAMPADTNANGDIFGGWVMARMDQAGGIAAVELAQGRVVTVKVDAMHFIRPMKVGDVLCVYTDLAKVGNTSLTLHIEAWAQRFQTRDMEKVTEATFIFVAIDDGGKPRIVPR
jgi:acyl-CoA thioesterase YciA